MNSLMLLGKIDSLQKYGQIAINFVAHIHIKLIIFFDEKRIASC